MFLVHLMWITLEITIEVHNSSTDEHIKYERQIQSIDKKNYKKHMCTYKYSVEFKCQESEWRRWRPRRGRSKWRSEEGLSIRSSPFSQSLQSYCCREPETATPASEPRTTPSLQLQVSTPPFLDSSCLLSRKRDFDKELSYINRFKGRNISLDNEDH